MTSNPRILTLDDIADQRAYEREREEFRRQVIAVKKRRRVPVGQLVTLTFESWLTMRFQVQEMARAERLTTDAQIQHELDVYNQLLPGPGELSATLFVELTDEALLRTWLPRLVGIEQAPELRIGTSGSNGSREPALVVRAVPDADHASQLTREEVTAAVHYVRFSLAPAEIAAFAAGPVSLAIDHPEYPEGQPGTVLSDDTRTELLGDLQG